MPLNEFMERRAKKEGKVTPKACIENLLKAIELGEVASVVFVARQPDGLIKTGWSNTIHTELLGLLECGKNHVLIDMSE
jgi:hypothetical protein